MAATTTKQQQLQNQINAISNATSNAQTNAVNANNKCQQQVSQLEQNRGTQEQNLDQVFQSGNEYPDYPTTVTITIVFPQ